MTAPEAAAPLLELRDVGKDYGSVIALDGARLPEKVDVP